MIVEELLECLTLGTNFLVIACKRIIKHFSANFIKLARPSNVFCLLLWGFLLFLGTISITAERVDRLEPSKLQLLLLILRFHIIRLLFVVEI